MWNDVEKKDYPSALIKLERYRDQMEKVNINPNLIYFCFKGRINSINKKYDETIESLQEGLKKYKVKDYDNYKDIHIYITDIYLNLIHALKKVNKTRGAAKYQEKLNNYVNDLLSKNNKKNIRKKILSDLGDMYLEYKRYEEGIVYLKKSLEIEENNQIEYYIAISKFKINQYKDAEEILLNLINDKEYNMLSYYWLIRIYDKTNSRKKMFEYLLKATENEIEFYMNYGWSQEDYLTQEEKQRYLEYLIEINQRENKNRRKLINIIIYTAFKLGKDEKAYHYIQKLNSNYVKHPNTYYWKIIYSLKRENNQEARRLYKEINSNENDFFDSYNWCEIKKNEEEIKKILAGTYDGKHELDEFDKE